MNPVFLVLLILLFLYFVSILNNNNNIEKFANITIQPIGLSLYHTCTDSEYIKISASSLSPGITGCWSGYCSNEPKGGSYGPTVKKCYDESNENTQCFSDNTRDTCVTGLKCGRFNNDTNIDSTGATPKYCIRTDETCNYNKKNRGNQCLQGKRCNDNNNCVNN